MQMSSQHDLSPPAPSSTRPHQPMKSEEQFLHEPTLAFLESHSDQLRLSSSSTLFVLSLSKLNLNSIGDIGQFRHVRICDLGSNFIETIDALVLNCQQLVKLDLHSNRISRLPNEDRWKEMLTLKILYLHNNLLSSYDDVKSLARAPVLQVLTLYDTPLSLKKNYRHHLVNTIWSLKALDSHVIADDEIIEKTRFPAPYSAYAQAFKLNLYIPTARNATLETELKLIGQLLQQTNRIQSRHCPVLVLQKNFRMWLVRLKLKKMLLASHRPLPIFLRPKHPPASWDDRPRTSTLFDEYYRLPHTDPFTSIQPHPTEINISLRQPLPLRSPSNTVVGQPSPLLVGHKLAIVVHEPLDDLTDEIRAARQYVNNLKNASHSKQRQQKAEIPKARPVDRPTNRHHAIDDRLLRTLHGNIAFGCLEAIDKAYDDRTAMEHRKHLTHRVEATRQEHSFITAQIQDMNEERRVAIHRSKDQDRMKQAYHRHRLEHTHNELHDFIQEQRALLLEQQNKRREQVAFSRRFGAQHLSVSNALQRHENHSRAQTKARQAVQLVAEQRQTSDEQARLMDKYLSQRQHVRHALSNIERKQLDIQSMRDANERLLQAQQRVAHIRARDSNIRQFTLLQVESDEKKSTPSLTESLLERESLYDAITDHMSSRQIVQ